MTNQAVQQDAPPHKQEGTQAPKKNSLWRGVLLRLLRNKAAVVGLVVIFILIICAIFAEQLAPYGYDEQNYSVAFQGPSAAFPLGTDNLGRCILSRIIYGARISLLVGFVSVGISTVLGSILGAVAAYYGGKTDNIIMRIMDILLAIPGILLAISIAASLGPGLINLMIAVGISSVPGFARVVRATVLSIKGQEFIEAARSIGSSDAKIIAKHILPNSMAPIIVQSTLGVAGAILSAASLSFIGLGIQAPVPEWGAMLSAGRQYIRDYWHIVTFPGIAIMITIFALNLFGDGLRDALDPRLKN